MLTVVGVTDIVVEQPIVNCVLGMFVTAAQFTQLLGKLASW